MHVMDLQLHLVKTKSVRILTKYSETYHKTLSEFVADHITMLCCEHAALIINVSQNWSFDKCKTLTSWHGLMTHGSYSINVRSTLVVLCSIDKCYTHKKADSSCKLTQAVCSRTAQASNPEQTWNILSTSWQGGWPSWRACEAHWRKWTAGYLLDMGQSLSSDKFGNPPNHPIGVC